MQGATAATPQWQGTRGGAGRRAGTNRCSRAASGAASGDDGALAAVPLDDVVVHAAVQLETAATLPSQDDVVVHAAEQLAAAAASKRQDMQLSESNDAKDSEGRGGEDGASRASAPYESGRGDGRLPVSKPPPDSGRGEFEVPAVAGRREAQRRRWRTASECSGDSFGGILARPLHPADEADSSSRDSGGSSEGDPFDRVAFGEVPAADIDASTAGPLDKHGEVRPADHGVPGSGAEEAAGTPEVAQARTRGPPAEGGVHLLFGSLNFDPELAQLALSSDDPGIRASIQAFRELMQQSVGGVQAGGSIAVTGARQ